MRLFDISMTINEDMPVYKGRPSKRPSVSIVSDFATGTIYETAVAMNMHTGTHMDAPKHLFEDGGTIERIDLERVITRCKVFDFSQVEERITREQLAAKDVAEGDFILLKTKNSYLDILEGEFIYLDKSGAEYLRDKKVKGVGIDALGIERGQPGHETHKILLGAGIIILEGIRLKEILEDEYLLIAAPLKVYRAEAAPVRAILAKQE